MLCANIVLCLWLECYHAINLERITNLVFYTIFISSTIFDRIIHINVKLDYYHYYEIIHWQALIKQLCCAAFNQRTYSSPSIMSHILIYN